MTGIVDVGGGMRCVYSGGVYDCFLDNNIKIDYCLGVSAGSANLMSYACGQRGRNYVFYTDYALRKEYMSLGNLLRTGSYIGFDYIFSVLCNDDGENPLDYDVFEQNEMIYKAVATRASDGASIYFTKDDVSRNNYDILKASCCIPIVDRPYKIGEHKYYDGGIAEPIPIEKAFEDGCDKVVLVLSKPRQEYAMPATHIVKGAKILKRYPAVAALMADLHLRSAEILKKIEAYEKEGRLLVLEPDDCFGMSTLTRDKDAIEKMYHSGYNNALDKIHHTSFFEKRI